MASKDPRLNEFLNKVDELEMIVKGLQSDDGEMVQKAMHKADEMISKVEKQKKLVGEEEPTQDEEEGLPQTKTGFSKTVINKSLDDDMPGANDPNFDGMSQEGFMKTMEEDAMERFQRRKEREKQANVIKESGNEEFRKGNYEKALDFYTQALRLVKDNTALYTNRAQTFIKLQKYPQALLDCEWAIRVFPNCLKAHIHKGRAHLGLQEYKEARECYQRARECDPKKESLITEYLAEVDRAETAAKEEAETEKLFKSGNEEEVGIVGVLKRTQKAEQLPMFYSGGFRVLKSLLKSTADRTLFRQHSGMTLLTDHPYLPKCLKASPKSLSKEETDMVASAFDMYSEACRENDKNTELFLQTEEISPKIVRFLEVKVKGGGNILKLSLVNCLYTASQVEIGRRLLVTKFDVAKLLTTMFTLIRTNTSIAGPAANLLNNMALDKKFKTQLRSSIEETVLPAFDLLLREGSSRMNVIPSCITMVMNLTADKVIKDKLISRKELWENCSKLILKHRTKQEEPISIEILESTLGLVLNLTTEPSQYLREFGVSICENCLALIRENSCQRLSLARSLATISQILPNSIPAVESLCEKGVVILLLSFIKVEDEEEADCLKSALKALAACTQINEEARKQVVDNKGLGALLKLIKKDNEIVVGNAALCLSHCTQVPKVPAALAKTDIIKELLVLARDGKKPTVQQNCAILIAKLAQGDTKHLDRLRELHGIEILHSCMKYLK